MIIITLQAHACETFLGSRYKITSSINLELVFRSSQQVAHVRAQDATVDAIYVQKAEIKGSWGQN